MLTFFSDFRPGSQLAYIVFTAYCTAQKTCICHISQNIEKKESPWRGQKGKSLCGKSNIKPGPKILMKRKVWPYSFLFSVNFWTSFNPFISQVRSRDDLSREFQWTSLSRDSQGISMLSLIGTGLSRVPAIATARRGCASRHGRASSRAGGKLVSRNNHARDQPRWKGFLPLYFIIKSNRLWFRPKRKKQWTIFSYGKEGNETDISHIDSCFVFLWGNGKRKHKAQ